MSRRALVTGSSGFIGRHLVQALVADGYEVDLVDIADVCRPREAVRFLGTNEVKYEIAVHAAAYVKGRAAIDGKPTYLGAYNLQLDGAFFTWALRARPRHLVYISSSAVYPVEFQRVSGVRLSEDLVTPDDDMRLPDATYGLTKFVGERLAIELAADAPDVGVHIVRPFSGYGTSQSTEYPFGKFLFRAINHLDPFEIWGDGRQVRDWVHVDDVINAMRTVIDLDVRVPVNICTGRGVNFLQLAGLFAREVGYAPTYSTRPDAPTGVHYRVGDPARMFDIYEPKITIEDGVARAVRAVTA